MRKDEIDGSKVALSRAEESIGALWALPVQIREATGLDAGGRMSEAVRALESAFKNVREIWTVEFAKIGEVR